MCANAPKNVYSFISLNILQYSSNALKTSKCTNALKANEMTLNIFDRSLVEAVQGIALS